MTGIYQITCLANGHFYVGQTTNVETRWRTHRSELRRGSHCNPRLQRCFDEYGEGAFKFDVIETCSADELEARERRLLDLHFGKPDCLNISVVSMNRRAHKVGCRNARKLMSRSAKERWRNTSREGVDSIHESKRKPTVARRGDEVITFVSRREAARYFGLTSEAINVAVKRGTPAKWGVTKDWLII